MWAHRRKKKKNWPPHCHLKGPFIEAYLLTFKPKRILLGPALPVIVWNAVMFLNVQISIWKCEQIINAVIYCGVFCGNQCWNILLWSFLCPAFLFTFFTFLPVAFESESSGQTQMNKCNTWINLAFVFRNDRTYCLAMRLYFKHDASWVNESCTVS